MATESISIGAAMATESSSATAAAGAPWEQWTAFLRKSERRCPKPTQIACPRPTDRAALASIIADKLALQHDAWLAEREATVRATLAASSHHPYGEQAQQRTVMWEQIYLDFPNLSHVFTWGSMWTLPLLRQYVPNESLVTIAALGPGRLAVPAALVQAAEAQLREATLTLDGFDVGAMTAGQSGVAGKVGMALTEQDCRRLIDAVVGPVCLHAGGSMRTETKFVCREASANRDSAHPRRRFLPTSQLDYRFFSDGHCCVGACEAKRSVHAKKGFVQATLQLLLLQAKHGAQQPYFGVVSDGLHYFFVFLFRTTLYCHPTLYSTESWQSLRELLGILYSLMKGWWPSEVQAAVRAAGRLTVSASTTEPEPVVHAYSSCSEGEEDDRPASGTLRYTLDTVTTLPPSMPSPCKCQSAQQRCPTGQVCRSWQRRTARRDDDAIGSPERPSKRRALGRPAMAGPGPAETSTQHDNTSKARMARLTDMTGLAAPPLLRRSGAGLPTSTMSSRSTARPAITPATLPSSSIPPPATHSHLQPGTARATAGPSPCVLVGGALLEPPMGRGPATAPSHAPQERASLAPAQPTVQIRAAPRQPWARARILLRCWGPCACHNGRKETDARGARPECRLFSATRRLFEAGGFAHCTALRQDAAELAARAARRDQANLHAFCAERLHGAAGEDDEGSGDWDASRAVGSIVSVACYHAFLDDVCRYLRAGLGLPERDLFVLHRERP